MTFPTTSSFGFVRRNINLGNIEENNATGPTIAANLEFEKNTLMRKAKVISDIVNKKK